MAKTKETRNPFSSVKRLQAWKYELRPNGHADFLACVGRGFSRNRYSLSLCLTHANEYALDFRDLADEVDRFYLAVGKTSQDLRLIKDSPCRRKG